MMTIERRAGRLIGIRLAAPVTEDQCEPFETDVKKMLASTSGQIVFCTDLRTIGVLTDKVSEFIISSMRRRNPRLIRAALLLPPESAITALQFDRILREAGSAHRRSFRRETEAMVWLGEVMTPEEQQSLASFIAEGDPDAGRITRPPGSVGPPRSSRPSGTGFR